MEQESAKIETDKLMLELEDVMEGAEITEVYAKVTDGGGDNGGDGEATASTGIIEDREDITG